MSLARRHRRILLGSVIVGVAAGGVAWLTGIGVAKSVLCGWCVTAATHIGVSLWRAMHTTPDQFRQLTDEVDEGRWRILAATIGASLASLAAVVWEVSGADPTDRAASILLALLTIGLSWSFVHVLFTHHYSHEYWHEEKGLTFPGTTEPDVFEFLYFAFTIGMALQVADVSTNSAPMRRLVLAHALVSFLFNAAILGAAVNVAAGLLGSKS